MGTYVALYDGEGKVRKAVRGCFPLVILYFYFFIFLFLFFSPFLNLNRDRRTDQCPLTTFCKERDDEIDFAALRVCNANVGDPCFQRV